MLSTVLLVSCKSGKKQYWKAEAPPKAVVVPDMDANHFKVDHPEQFPLAAAVERKAAPELNVTGVVSPDVFAYRAGYLACDRPGCGDTRAAW